MPGKRSPTIPAKSGMSCAVNFGSFTSRKPFSAMLFSDNESPYLEQHGERV